MFDGMDMTFRNLKLRPKSPDCAVCGHNSTIHELIDYEEFCGAKANDKNPNLKILSSNERISVNEYDKLSKLPSKPYLLIDVRSNQEFEMCHLKDSINVPFTSIESKNSLDNLNILKKELDKTGVDVTNGNFYFYKNVIFGCLSMYMI